MTASHSPSVRTAAVGSVWALSAPVAMGYIPLGAVFGFLFVQAGGALWQAVLASVLIYAGSAQYLMIPMLAAGLPLSAIALATLVVNLRHVFYGLSLLDRLPTGRWRRCYCIFALTDETYSVLTTWPAGTPARHMAGVALLNHGWWVLGTALGAVLGAQAQLPLAGLDFALAALFALLAAEQWRSRHSATPLWVALGAYALASVLAPAHALLVAIGLSVAVGLALHSVAKPPQPVTPKEGA